MLQMLYPDEYLDSTSLVPFEELYKKGFRGILFDIDNTLVPHGAPADDNAIALYKKLGFVEIGRRKKYYQNTFDALVMKLSL